MNLINLIKKPVSNSSVFLLSLISIVHPLSPTACSSHCSRCDINGINKCDKSGCQSGYTFILSTKICERKFASLR